MSPTTAECKVITGNHAASWGALLSRVEVISAYPITPQTQIVELLSKFCSSGQLPAKFLKVESEHSAMAALVGAASAGARCFTATSSQGLALMHEMLHWAAGARLPIVMAEVNRAMAPPWSVYTDQNDSLSQRDTGWMQIYCESSQEVLDSVIQAYRAAEQVLLPAMIVLDAFFLSHTAEPVEIPDQELVDRYLPKLRVPHQLDFEKPATLSCLCTTENYMEFRFELQRGMERALDALEEADREFSRLFGRSYGLTEAYRCEDADLVLVTSSTITSTARSVIDQLREEGEKVGLLKVRVFRPFPAASVRRHLASARKVAVVDRNISFGAGGIFAQEIKAAIYNHLRKPVFGFVAGLGGRDVTPEVLREIVDYAASREEPEDLVWIGVKP